MKNIYLIADYTVKDYAAGAEMVDDNISKGLGIEIIKPEDFEVDHTCHYIISNATRLGGLKRRTLIHYGNYSIFEHDYKIHPTRQPHRYPNYTFPKHELINLDFYKKAKVVYLQSQDHLDCFLKNGVEGNFINLSTSIWSNEELDSLANISHASYGSYKFAIIGDTGPDKGQENAIAWCKANTIDYEILPKIPKEQFYKVLGYYPTLVYFPNVKESFCRLVVEARCLYMNVVAPKTFGAVKETWYTSGIHGIELVDFLREKSRSNLITILNNSI